MVNWKEVLEKVRNREVDMLSGAAETLERKNYLLFSSPHIVLPGVIITRKANRDLARLEDLRGKRVAVPSGYLWEEFLSADYPEIELVPVQDIPVALKHVAFGEADAVVVSLPLALFYIEKFGTAGLVVSGKTPYESRLSFAVRKDWPTFHRILEKTLDSQPQRNWGRIR